MTGEYPFFKVYYRDGSTYVGPPEYAPILDVALILQADRNHNVRKIKADYYFWTEKGWLGVGEGSLICYQAGTKWWRWLIGVMMHQDDWNEINKVANADPDFKERTGYYRGERK